MPLRLFIARSEAIPNARKTYQNQLDGDPRFCKSDRLPFDAVRTFQHSETAQQQETARGGGNSEAFGVGLQISRDFRSHGVPAHERWMQKDNPSHPLEW